MIGITTLTRPPTTPTSSHGVVRTTSASTSPIPTFAGRRSYVEV